MNKADDEGGWPTASIRSSRNYISLEIRFPWKDIELYFKSKSYILGVVGIIACFIPDPTVSKAIGVAAGIGGIASGLISDVIAKKKSNQSIRIGISFNYRITVKSKYVYVVNTRWVKIGYWAQWKTTELYNFKWWVKV